MTKILFLCLLVASCLAKFTTGDFYKDNFQFVLLDSFCFDTKGGMLTIDKVELDPRYPNQKLLLYHDVETRDGFLMNYNSQHSCDLKSLGAADTLTSRDFTNVTAKRSFTSIIPRWWYLVVANCDAKEGGPEGVGLSNFEITWINGEENTEVGRFKKHFSFAEEGIFEMAIFTLLALLVIIPVTVCVYFRRRKDEDDLSHKVLFVLLIAEGIHLFSNILQIAHRDAYSRDGMGLPAAYNATIVLDATPPLILIGLFICLAKGMYIASNTARDLRSIVEVMILYFAATVGILAWTYSTFNPALNDSPLLSEGGTCLVVLRVLTLLWFLSSLQSTWKRERKTFKRSFYATLCMFAIFFFLILPMEAMAASLRRINSQEKTVFIMHHLFHLITYGIFLIVLHCNREYLRKTETQFEHGEVAQDEFADVAVHTGNENVETAI